MFVLATKLLQPVAIQLKVEGHIIELAQQPPFYNQTDIIIATAAAFVSGVCVVKLLSGWEKAIDIVDIKAPRPNVTGIVDAAEDDGERAILGILVKAGGSSFQSDLVERSGFSKGKVSLTLDRLEARGVVKRVRSGMTNLVSLVGKG